jgi:hypothetical protein
MLNLFDLLQHCKKQETFYKHLPLNQISFTTKKMENEFREHFLRVIIVGPSPPQHK